MPQLCSSDGSFGPAVGGQCRGGFDFTLTFEESILGIAPQCLFLLASPIRYLALRAAQRRVFKDSHLGFLKAFTCVLYSASSIVQLAIWLANSDYKTKVSIASASFEFLGAVAITVLSRLEHVRAIRPSHMLQFFLLVMLACHAVRLRTLLLMHYSNAIIVISTIHLFLTAFLLLLESLDKSSLLSNAKRYAPEDTIDLFARRFFWHVNSIFRTGYKKTLTAEDLYHIDQDLSSDSLRSEFEKAWNGNRSSPSRWAIYKTIHQVLWKDFWLPAIPGLLRMGTKLATPFLIMSMVRYVEQNDDEDQNTGYGLLAFALLNWGGMAIFESWYSQSVSRFATKLRSVLISLIYHRTLRIHPKDVDISSATVLMNVDVEKVMLSCELVHDLWILAITCTIAIYILYEQIGLVFVSPLITVLLSVLYCSRVGRLMKPRQKAWTAATEQRVTSIASATASMKGIRMLGLSDIVHSSLTMLRVIEVNMQLKIRKLLSMLLAVSNNIFQLTTLATYVPFVAFGLSHGQNLNFENLFGSLSALKLVTVPLLTGLQAIASVTNGLASLERIQTYLRGEIIESRITSTLQQQEYQDAPNEYGMDSAPFEVSRRVSSSVIHLDGASFGLIPGQHILKDVNISVSKSEFVMVLGQIGSGKSLLLRALVSEMWHEHGIAELPISGIAFCAQTPWLWNGTIRQNIVADESLDIDEAWYSKVVWACALKPDFRELKFGDQTFVGSKGISLSGGQKNRISLARALYSRKAAYIIDDVLSGLDNATEKIVFARVFGRSGILRSSGATVILATHAAHWASEADQAVIMSRGTVSEKGPHSTLRGLGELTRKSGLDKGEQKPGISETDESYDPTSVVDGEELKPSIQPPGGNDDERRSGDAEAFWYYLRSVGLKQLLIFASLLVGHQLATTAQFVWLKQWAGFSDQRRETTVRNMGIFIALTIFNVVMTSVFLWHFVVRFMPRSSLTLHADQLKALMNATFSFLVATDTGSIINRFSQDMVLVDGPLPNAWINFTVGLLACVSVLAIVTMATPPVAALIPFLAGVSYLLQRVYLRTSRQVRLIDLEAKAPLCTHFIETLSGIMTIRAFGWRERYMDKNNALLDASQSPFYLLFMIQNWLKLVLQLQVAGLVVAVVGLAIALRSKVDAGFLGLALVGCIDLGFESTILISEWTRLETSLSAISRVRRFTNDTPQEDTSSAQSAPPQLAPSWPTKGGITFSNLSASYSLTSPPVLNGFTLSIPPAQQLAICGRTGSGKSSLVSSLLGLLHTPVGYIVIDGVRTDSVPLQRLRQSVISLPQEPVFLPGRTVRGNLLPREDDVPEGSADNEIGKVLTEIGLWSRIEDVAAQYVASAGESAENGTTGPRRSRLRRRNAADQSPARQTLSSPLDLPVQHLTSSLSHGEQQLFCIARAILAASASPAASDASSSPRIVILDEATSSVDAATDARVQRVLRERVFPGRTVLAIAHRVGTVMDFDRVVVLEKGREVEDGVPAELVGVEGGWFRGLVEKEGRGS